MNRNRIRDAYDASVNAYVEKCYHELSYKPLDRQLLERFVGLTDKGKVLDVGCGPGQTTKYIHEKGAKVIGTDLSEQMIIAARRLNPRIEFRVGDLFHLQGKRGEFAGAAAFYAIVNYQYRDIGKIFIELHRVLRKKGVLLIAFHAGGDTLHVDDFMESGKPLDFYFLDENRIISMLRKTGFEIIEALVRFPYPQEYPSRRAYMFARKK